MCISISALGIYANAQHNINNPLSFFDYFENPAPGDSGSQTPAGDNKQESLTNHCITSKTMVRRWGRGDFSSGHASGVYFFLFSLTFIKKTCPRPGRHDIGKSCLYTFWYTFFWPPLLLSEMGSESSPPKRRGPNLSIYQHAYFHIGPYIYIYIVASAN